MENQAWKPYENLQQGEKHLIQVAQKSYSVAEVPLLQAPLVAVGEETLEAISDLQEFELVVDPEEGLV